ncbi:MAG: hypothetical protein KatS3mg090_0042 [Patescibacteria group bacterium]|nr:MAG: hypothetical protein KatS3mg090_0042 [Patescibacteria group bacterium]
MDQDFQGLLKQNERILWVGLPEPFPFTARRYFNLWFLLFYLLVIDVLFLGLMFYFYKFYNANLNLSFTYVIVFIIFFCSLFFLSYITLYVLAKPVVSAFGTRYYLTDQRLIVQYGLVKKGFKIIDLDQITNISFKQSVFDKIYKTESADIFVNYTKNNKQSGLFLIENIYGYKYVSDLIEKAKNKNLEDFL